MDPAALERLLLEVQTGSVTPQQALRRLRDLPFEDIGFAKVDHHRALRRGFPEAIFGEGKTPAQVQGIVGRILDRRQNVLVTRTSADVHALLLREHPGAVFHAAARCITIVSTPAEALPGRLGIVCAGTSDIPVAEEAAVAAEFYGAEVDRVHDVGVAGLQRLLNHADSLRQADVLIVVAGMEGALPSVVGGLTEAPLIAVPTSVGYGASFQGLAALLAMLNSCASGIAVVNIDNGFGAAHLAATILRKCRARP